MMGEDIKGFDKAINHIQSKRREKEGLEIAILDVEKELSTLKSKHRIITQTLIESYRLLVNSFVDTVRRLHKEEG